jgi:hypothetical protein
MNADGLRRLDGLRMMRRVDSSRRRLRNMLHLRGLGVMLLIVKLEQSLERCGNPVRRECADAMILRRNSQLSREERVEPVQIYRSEDPPLYNGRKLREMPILFVD